MRPRVNERPSRVFRATRRYTLAARKLGLRIRSMRKAREWTLEKVSELTGLELSHVQQIEAGKINITFATLLRISEGFGSPIEALFEGGDAYDGNAAEGPKKRPGGRPSSTGRPARTNLQVGTTRRNPAFKQADDPETVMRLVADSIREARKEAGLTQHQLADRLEVSIKYVQRVEAGRANLTITSLVRIANALGIPLSRLLAA